MLPTSFYSVPKYVHRKTSMNLKTTIGSEYVKKFMGLNPTASLNRNLLKRSLKSFKVKEYFSQSMVSYFPPILYTYSLQTALNLSLFLFIVNFFTLQLQFFFFLFVRLFLSIFLRFKGKSIFFKWAFPGLFFFTFVFATNS